MATDIEYAQLATRVYAASDENKTGVPAGWTELAWQADSSTTGFSAGAYRKDNEVVIAYTGTNDLNLDWVSNVMGGSGILPAPQIFDAMRFYLDVKAANPGTTISFTGHSLGGGLASIMSVFFDKQAKTFDEAPFAYAAINPPLLSVLEASLLLTGYTDLDFALYNASFGTLFPIRQNNISHIYLEGEILGKLRLVLPAIAGSQAPVSMGASTLSALDRHAMTLLTAMLGNNAFESIIQNMPNLATNLLDPFLFGVKDRRIPNQTDLLSNLLQWQYGSVSKAADDRLDHFTSEIQKLIGNAGVVQTQLQDVLSIVVMEYFATKAQTEMDAISIFNIANGGLHFKYSDIGATDYKSLPRLASAIDSLLSTAEKPFSRKLIAQNAWHIQQGGDALAWTADAGDPQGDAALGGIGVDILDAGAGEDILIGGAGSDVLTGGAGNDILLGGLGHDFYLFNAGDGNDILLDADGEGTIKIELDGELVALGIGESDPGIDGRWTSHDGRVRYSHVPDADGAGTLIITWGSQSLTVRNYQAGQLGLTVTDKPQQPAMIYAYTDTYLDTDPDNGSSGADNTKGPDGWEVERTAGGGLDGSVHSIGTASNDAIRGAAGARNLIEGKGGIDQLLGGDADDRLYAGSVIDVAAAIEAAQATQAATEANVLQGGRGNDLLVGGTSSYLYGGGEEDTLIGGGGDDVIQGDTVDGQFGIYGQSGDAFTHHWDYDSDKQKYSYYVQLLRDGVATVHTRLSLLDANGGADVIVAGGGNDIVMGELSDDYLSLGKGDDVGMGGEGSDTVHGGAGNDLIFGDFNWDAGAPTGDETPGQLANHAGLEGQYHGNDMLDGGTGDDTIQGNGGDDVIAGGDGNDVLWGDDGVTPGSFHGNDTIDGGAGDDTIVGGGRDDELYGGAGSDEIWGDANVAGLEVAYHGVDYLDGGEGDDTLYGGGGADQIFGGDGDDTMRGDGQEAIVAGAAHGDDFLDGEGGNDAMWGDGGGDILVGGDGDDVLDGDGADLAGQYHGDDYLDGGSGNDTLVGNGGNDTLIGGDGDDALVGDNPELAVGFHGNDFLDGGAGEDFLYGGGGNDTLHGGADDDYLDGQTGNDTLDGGAGNDTLFGGDGNDTLEGAGGNDMMSGGAGDDRMAGGDGSDQMTGDDGNDTMDGGAGDDVLFADAGDDVLTGGEGSDHLHGGDGNDALHGGSGDDFLFGDAGDDILDGGGGYDCLDGGTGNNTYLLSDRGASATGIAHTTIVDGGGVNTIRFTDDTTAESIVFKAVQGSSTDFILQYGQDSVYVRNGLQKETLSALQFANGQVMTRAEFMALAPVQNLAGSGGNDDIVGSAWADTLGGGSGDDRLAGGKGNDTLRGGLGNDIYVFNAGDGADIINNAATDNAAAIDTIAMGSGIAETDILVTRTGNNLVVKIGAFDSITVQNHFLKTSNNKIDRIAFADGTAWDQAAIASKVVLQGATGGNDNLGGFDTPDIIHGLDGNDIISGNDGDDQLFGDNGSDTLRGGNGNDALDGGTGNDTLAGGLGSDTYVFARGMGDDTVSETGSSAGDIDVIRMAADIAPTDVLLRRNSFNQNGLDIVLKDGSGSMLVQDYFLQQSNACQVEQMQFADGTIWDQATIQAMMNARNAAAATAGNDNLRGFAWDDSLDGAGGNDTLYGYDGNDSLAGGAGNDSLYGGNGDDLIDGGAGNDELNGGAGNDTYVFGRGHGSDRIWETHAADGSIDTLALKAGIAPGDVALYQYGDNLVLKLAGSPDELLMLSYYVEASGGQPFDNKIENIVFADGTVWDQATILSKAIPQGAANAMTGTAGDDSFIVDNTLDTVAEAANQGTDTVQSRFSWTLGANLENLALTGVLNVSGVGNALNNVIQGNSGNNFLYGMDGDDTLYGDAGNDTITGDAGADVLYGGDGDDHLTGGTGNDAIYGGAGNDTLDGSQGTDLLVGGTGDDTYIVSGYAANAQITELAGEGIDTIISNWGTGSSPFVELAGNIENLIINPNRPNYVTPEYVTGNALDNRLVGGDYGDIIDGRAGADTMVGGRGNDIFHVDNAGDRVIDNGGIDTVQSAISYTLGDGVENLTLAPGAAGIDGTGNAGNNIITGNAAANVLDGGAGNDRLIGGYGGDTLIGGVGSDTYVVSNSADRVVIDNRAADNASAIDTIEYAHPHGYFALYQAGDDLLIKNDSTGGITVVKGHFAYDEDNAIDQIKFSDGSVWDRAAIEQHIVRIVTTADADTVAGTPIADTIHGLAGNDTISGEAGNDTLSGDEGDDTLRGDDGNDMLDGGSGADDLYGGYGDDTLVGGSEGDYLYGGHGNDVLDGGAGDDYLSGGYGNDVYVFRRGDGRDQVWDGDGTAGNVDTIRFDATIAAAEVSVTRDENSLYLHVAGGTDRMQLINAYSDADSAIERVEFADGTVWTAADLLARIVIAPGTPADDLIYGFNTNDVLYGLGGNDMLSGGGGADQLHGGDGDDTLEGNAGNDTLQGGAGSDFLDGGAGADRMSGGTGNDIYIVDNSGDVVTENAGEGIDLVAASLTHTLAANVEALFLDGSSAINGTGNALNNLIVGNSAKNTLNGQGGIDILQGAGGNDALSDTSGNNLLDGGAGTDTLTGGAGRDFFIGGAGNDTITTGAGADVIAFNRGDGMDVVNASKGKDNTVSLGNGIEYADLLFKKSANNLILATGAGDQITFKDWYASTNNRSIANLQILIEDTADYDAASSSSIHNKKMESFDFAALVTAFDQARKANSRLTSWALSSSLLKFHLGGSNTAAIGGDLAYQYAKSGDLSNLSMTPAQAILASPSFGAAAQNLQNLTALQDLSPRLM